MINLRDLFNHPDMFSQLANSPEYTDTLSGIFDEDEEERRRKAMLVGNYSQFSTMSKNNPQLNLGLQDTNMFDSFYL